MSSMPDGEDEQVGGQVDERAQPCGHADQVDEQQRLLFDDETWKITSLKYINIVNPSKQHLKNFPTHCQ